MILDQEPARRARHATGGFDHLACHNRIERQRDENRPRGIVGKRREEPGERAAEMLCQSSELKVCTGISGTRIKTERGTCSCT